MHYSIILVLMQWLRSGTEYRAEQHGVRFVSRYGPRMRGFAIALALVLLAVATACSADAVRSTTTRARITLLILALPFIAGAVWFVAKAFYYRVTFDADAATIRRPFRAEEILRFGQVIGYRRKKREYRVETERGWVQLTDEYADGWRFLVERCELQLAGNTADHETQN